MSHSAGSHPEYSSIGLIPVEQSQAIHDSKEKTTVLQTYLHLVKGNIGPGCLSLPWAFSKLGLAGGITSCILLCLWTSYNCHMVVELRRQCSAHTYPEVGEWAYGKKFKAFVTICICFQQLAICTVFLSFCGENILAVLPGEIHHAVVISLALPSVLALSCIPTLRKMTWATLAGTLTLLLALILILVAMDQHDGTDATILPTPSFPQVPLATCAILYSFEGICLILPVEGAMKSPRYFGQVFWVAMATVCLAFCIVAGCSVLVYGDVDNGSITAYILKNFTDHREMILIANTFVSVSVLLTYPLQLFPCLELVGAWVEQKRRRGLEPLSMDEENEEEKESFIPGDSPQLRLGLVMLTYVVAIVIPNVQQLISLAGALCGSSTALLIPPLLELQSVRRTTNSLLSKQKCYVSFFFGIVFCLIGSGASIVNIIRLYMQKRD